MVFAVLTVITDGVVIWRTDAAAKNAMTMRTRERRRAPRPRPRQSATIAAPSPFQASRLSCKAATVCSEDGVLFECSFYELQD